MEKEGFSITNISIIGKMPCCDIKLVKNGQVVWQEQQMPFDEVRELMSQTKLNCDNVIRQLDAIHKK
jgi:hypothetical protein